MFLDVRKCKGKSMNDTLQTYYDKHNGRLPVNPIPDDENDKALLKCNKPKTPTVPIVKPETTKREVIG